MKILVLSVSVLLNPLFFFPLFGQYTIKKGEAVSATFSEATPIKLNSDYVFLYGLPGRVYTVPEQFHPQKLKRYSQASIIRYNENFKFLSSANLSDDFQDQIIEGTVVRNGTLYILSSTKGEEGKTFYISTLNSTCRISGKQGRLFFSDHQTNGVYNCSSFDSSYNLFISLNRAQKKETQSIDGCITDRNMTVVSTFNASLDFEEEDLLFLHFFLVDKSEFAMIYGVKGDKKSPASYFFISFDGKGKIIREKAINTSDRLIANPVFSCNKKEITFYGLTSEKGAKFFSGTAMAKINTATGETIVFKNNVLPPRQALKNVSESSFNEIGKGGIDKDYMLKKACKMNDGASMFIYEKGSESVYQSYFDAARTRSSYQVNRFHRSDILLLKVDTSGTINWLAVIPRSQTESDLTVTGGMVVTKDNNDGVHILFHDSERNKAVDPSEKAREVNVTYPKTLSLAHVFITPTGQVRKDFLFPNNTVEEFLSPEYSLGYDNEILFSAAYTRVFKKSTYHFGTIRFK